MALTDIQIKSLIQQANQESRRIKKSDGNGMYILARPGQAALWQMSYRFDGKQKTLD
jgi:hypothetical protein